MWVVGKGVSFQKGEFMAELLIGAGALGVLILWVRLAEVRDVVLARWQWGVVFLWVLYTAFVLLAVVEFLREGTPKGAVVMGTILGFGSIVWAVLLERFLFKRRIHGGLSSVPEGGTHA